LADALEAGIVESAALDVHADEPRINARLLRMAGLQNASRPGRVMLTCHNAGGTVDTHIGFEELSMRNIMAVLEGGKPITPVNTHFLKPKI
jgi:lactate dehydrogenase-like 2-hydroxyacid dehydrogenase